MVQSNENENAAVACRRVEVQVLTTLKCNLRCSYCSLGTGEVLGSQKNARYAVEQLAAFVERQLARHEVYFTLYGGEAVTDRHRGKGVYRKVLDNVAAVRAGTDGTLTARVTWWSAETTFAELDALTRSFDYVYFQFAQEAGANTAEAVRKKKAVLARLVDRFFAADDLYPVVPIMGTVRNKVLPLRIDELCGGKTQCRVSTNLLNIMPDGKIYPCPDMMYDAGLLQGDVVANWLRISPLQPHPNMPCRACPAYAYCRGNCMKNLYLAYVKDDTQWRMSVTEPICDLIRFLGDEVDRHDPAGWYARAPLPVRNRVAAAEVYEFCEVMP